MTGRKDIPPPPRHAKRLLREDVGLSISLDSARVIIFIIFMGISIIPSFLDGGVIDGDEITSMHKVIWFLCCQLIAAIHANGIRGK